MMMISVCRTNKNRDPFLSVNAMPWPVRRWLRTWDVLEEKERTMDVIKRYVEVNDDVENETMKYLGPKDKGMKGIV